MIVELEPEIKRLRALARKEINQADGPNPGVSTTGEVGLLVIEAELVDSDEHEIQNCHIPATVDVMEQAREQIESEGNEPAWSE